MEAAYIYTYDPSSCHEPDLCTPPLEPRPGREKLVRQSGLRESYSKWKLLRLSTKCTSVQRITQNLNFVRACTAEKSALTLNYLQMCTGGGF